MLNTFDTCVWIDNFVVTFLGGIESIEEMFDVEKHSRVVFPKTVHIYVHCTVYRSENNNNCAHLQYIRIQDLENGGCFRNILSKNMQGYTTTTHFCSIIWLEETFIA